MRLTRRDALAALSAVGAGGVAGCSAPSAARDDETTTASDANPPELGEDELETLVALAAVLYPSEVENAAEFVEAYVRPRVRDRPEHGRGMVAAIETLDEYAENLEGERYAALDAAAREELLAYMAVDTADPDPDGDDDERVRYYLVNDLLFGLYASPTGASLAGLENPPGYPGGTASYQKGPE
ncbi:MULTISPECIES: gluconate 2-dehydrogenase subunit 3 family protein [Halolamina]|uniref:Gluconate 2-dehydrogenase subunit 3 n=1 Tax=Halolamina pelagica TaxID=699431 RepID=A0A1I5MN70_9EURY|nr:MULTISPECIES: gluconate 2-dehydrogenase subunit 3 family protein [Halolamina]NHX36095.1 gluconate 2-dehydrogenase subunit 3 family protein [Halolamina sp. R1-12]SFP11038.1 Gluconate 2-dehydrogenase subunit 3 [Halolamina pelagica]